MRRPIQCEGIERGPQRAAQIGVVGSVQPQFLSSLLSGLGSVAKVALPAIAGMIP
jgi:hypothetical protein